MLVLAVVFVAALAEGQAKTPASVADGVQAMVRGDYQTALRILKPLGEDSATPDPIAQFFLATLYESGHGVPPDRMRACSLYLSAGAPENPLASQSLLLAQTIREQMGPVGGKFCAPGVWRALPTTTFRLGPDHWVRFDEAGTTVGYQGAEQRLPGRNGGNGWIYPPMRYTPLDVRAPVAGRRHFFEMFIWMPDESSGQKTWTLGWLLIEVSGADATSVAGSPSVLTIAAVQPPTPFDPSTVSRLQVDANGEAEWAIISGPNQKSAVIPPKVVR